MAASVFRVGNGAGFSGDRIDAPGPVVDTLIASGGPAALFLETLAERTIALAQLARNRDPRAGYEPTLERLLSPILARCAAHRIPILGNFGAANPPAAARVVARLADRLGLGDLRIAVVAGDDVLGSLDLGAAEVYEADAGLPERDTKPISANAYLGAEPLVVALRMGADVVVAGRVADPSLALAPLIHHFGWDAEDWDRLAVGAVCGHLLECGSQVTGGVFYDPGVKDVPDPANLGFPIAEVSADGDLVVTKAANTGGLVDQRTVTEQLLYEVHDPAAYVTPDVIMNIASATLEDDGPDRVRIRGVRGHARPDRLKVTACLSAGYLGEGEFSLAGPNALARARTAADVLLERLRRRGLPVRARVDLIGVSSVLSDDAGHGWRTANPAAEPEDIRVRLSVEAASEDDADQSAREALAMLCCGPAGSAGARWRVVPRFATRSYLVPRDAVPTSVRIETAAAIMAEVAQ